jgi:hypothetical protein
VISRSRAWWKTPPPGRVSSGSSKPRYSMLISAPSTVFGAAGLAYMYFVNSAVSKDAAAQLGKDASQVLISANYGFWLAVAGFLGATSCSAMATANAVRAGEWRRLRTSFRAALGSSATGSVQPSLSPDARDVPTMVAGAASVVRKLKVSRRARVTAASGIALIIAGSVGTVFLSGKTAPQQVAMDFVNAIGNRDGSAAWANMTVSPTSNTSAAAALVNEQSFSSALSAMQPEGISVVHVVSQQSNTSSTGGSGSSNSTDQAVTVGFQTARGPQTATLDLTLDRSTHRYLLFPSWKVVLVPTQIQINTVSGGGQLLVDGIPISGASAWLLGGHHAVEQRGSSLLQSAQAPVDVPFWSGQPASQTSVTLSPHLTATALASARKATDSAFTQCTAITTSASDTCPQSLYTGASSTSWTLIGDPADSLSISSAPADQSSQNSAQFSGSGVYAMVAAYADDSDPGNNSRQLTSGPYQVNLSWQNGAFLAASIQSGGNAQAPTPGGVTNAQVLQTVATGFKNCAARTVLQPASCPQSEYGNSPTNVAWTLTGTPAGANATSVQFSGAQDAYVVTGAYTMQYSYTDVFSGPQTGSEVQNYSAQVLWDGKNLVLVSITRA